jgi:hypothetical protein
VTKGIIDREDERGRIDVRDDAAADRYRVRADRNAPAGGMQWWLVTHGDTATHG